MMNKKDGLYLALTLAFLGIGKQELFGLKLRSVIWTAIAILWIVRLRNWWGLQRKSNH